jgi:hypothetical protein
MVAEEYVRMVADGPKIASSDSKALSDLAMRMRKCELNLGQLGFKAEVDNTETLKKIVRRLPDEMRRKWAIKSHAILTKELRPTSFAELSRFVNEWQEVADSVFGRELSDHKSQARSAGAPSSSQRNHAVPRATMLATRTHNYDAPRPTSRRTMECPACKSASCCSLADCQKFHHLHYDERRAAVIETRACFNCLRIGHFTGACPLPPQCNVPDCNRRHHPCLHRWARPSGSAPAETEAPMAVSHAVTSEKRGAYLGIIPVTLTGPNDTHVDTCALLDNGSTHSFVDESIIAELGIKGQNIAYSVSTLTSRNQQSKGLEVDLTVLSPFCPLGTMLTNVWTSPTMRMSCDAAASLNDLLAYPHLRDLPLLDVRGKQVRLLIGAASGVLMPLEIRSPPTTGQPYAERTLLGWVVRGPSRTTTPHSVDRHCETNFISSVSRCSDTTDQLTRIWNMEFEALPHADRSMMSFEDKQALSKMKKSLSTLDGRYEIALPWHEGVNLPNNRAHAVVRLNHLQRKLQWNVDLHKEYTEQIQEYLDKGYAREVEHDETPSHGRTWYLPHHGVHNPNKLSVRVVFDGAAKYKGTSLNDNLMQGPDLTNNLAGVLIRFRKERVAVTADIKAMFHQVLVPRCDQNALRFLWWPRGELSCAPRDYCMTRHVFGLRSSPSCAAFALHQAAEDHGHDFSSNSAKCVAENFYVDDFLLSVKTPELAIATGRDVQALIARGGFRLTKWMSSDKAVLEGFDIDDLAPPVRDLDLAADLLPCSKTLGLIWDAEADTFKFKIALEPKPLTKRGMLSMISAIFDPLGLVSPTILEGRYILQTVTRCSVQWDEQLPDTVVKRWTDWCSQLVGLDGYAIPRAYGHSLGMSEATDCELHVFSDASETGYGACAYVRMTLEDVVTTTLIMGKSRLAPLKATTIPRLELTAAMLASRVRAFVEDELNVKFKRIVMWTDSTITLAYIYNTTSRYKAFVANRLVTIHELTSVDEWRYVPTQHNPADLASRGFAATDDRAMARWLTGPEFLRLPVECWPESPSLTPLLADDPETKHTITCATEATAADDDVMLRIARHFSSWERAVRAVALLQRCMKWLRNKEKKVADPLTPSELNAAELTLLISMQQRHFPKEYADSTARGQVAKNSRLISLDPHMKDGLLCTGSRLRFTSRSMSVAILPHKDPVTTLLIRRAHLDNGHVGTEQVLAILRNRFWIIKGRSAVRAEVSRCVPCRRQKAPLCTQQMAPVAEAQTQIREPPFSSVGIDYFGPFYVKQGRGTAKRYGCIFTCLTTRAVHLEVAHSLDTNSLLAAISRFIARRGPPKILHSDQGTNMTSADKELRSALGWSDDAMAAALSPRRIEWRFNAPHCSHRGGLWERLIRSARVILRALIKQQLLSDEGLSTVLCEVERILNDRPITQVSSDPRDPVALTPADLLLLRGNTCQSLCRQDPDPPLRRWWRQAQYVADVFWRRWIREYVPQLIARQKWHTKSRDLRMGDLVLVADHNLPRGQWPLGIIQTATPGRDGLVRSVTIRTTKSTLKRPVTQVALLEAAEEDAGTAVL